MRAVQDYGIPAERTGRKRSDGIGAEVFGQCILQTGGACVSPRHAAAQYGYGENEPVPFGRPAEAVGQGRCVCAHPGGQSERAQSRDHSGRHVRKAHRWRWARYMAMRRSAFARGPRRRRACTRCRRSLPPGTGSMADPFPFHGACKSGLHGGIWRFAWRSTPGALSAVSAIPMLWMKAWLRAWPAC